MLFYLVPAADGKPDQLEPTQRDANNEARARGLKVRAPDMEYNVPTDKEGLRGHLNTILSALQPYGSAAVDEQPEEPNPIVERSHDTSFISQSTYEATEIEDFILNRATVAQAENIFGCLGTRFKELAK